MCNCGGKKNVTVPIAQRTVIRPNQKPVYEPIYEAEKTSTVVEPIVEKDYTPVGIVPKENLTKQERGSLEYQLWLKSING